MRFIANKLGRLLTLRRVLITGALDRTSIQFLEGGAGKGAGGGDVFHGELDIFTFKINSTLNFNEKKKVINKNIFHCHT